MLLCFVIVASLCTVRLATRVGVALSRATNVVVVPGEEASEGRTKKPTAPLVTREVVEAEAAEDASATIAGKSAIRYFCLFHGTTTIPPSFARHNHHLLQIYLLARTSSTPRDAHIHVCQLFH
jgi:hypothetical protein